MKALKKYWPWILAAVAIGGLIVWKRRQAQSDTTAVDGAAPGTGTPASQTPAAAGTAGGTSSTSTGNAQNDAIENPTAPGTTTTPPATASNPLLDWLSDGVTSLLSTDAGKAQWLDFSVKNPKIANAYAAGTSINPKQQNKLADYLGSISEPETQPAATPTPQPAATTGARPRQRAQAPPVRRNSLPDGPVTPGSPGTPGGN